MNIGLIINTLSILLVVLIAIIYFSKKRVKISESKIYKMLLISTFIGFSVNGLSFYFDIYLKEQILIRIILIKFYYAYLLFFMALMTLYLFSFTKKEKYQKIVVGITSLSLLLNFILPLNFIESNNDVYISGANFIFVYVIVICSVIFWILFTLFNFTKDNQKKYLPIIVYSAFSIPMILIQYFYPDLLLEPFLIAYVLIFMYHAIENPDMKILEELHKSKEISDSANEEKTLFLYNMTQEIRNTTNKINNDANQILDSNSIEDNKNSARDIIATTSTFTNITNELLDVGTIDASNLKIYNSKYNIKNIIKQLVNVYTEICNNKDLKFITNIDHNIPESLYGDSINLKEVLNTILENSTKYTEKGFIEFDVNTIIKNDICRLIISIEDSGIGIKSEEINKIKLDNKSLSKANKLLTVMNGTMLISSDYGVGTKVKVILDQKIDKDNNEEISKYEDTLNNLKILVIDDSEAGLKIIDKLLKDINIFVDKSNNGKDCLDKIKINKYNLILLDEELTSISGKELLLKIKEIRNFNTPVILLTKDNNYEYNEEYIKEGFVDYIIKPIKKDVLLEKINKYTKDIK